MAKASNSAPAPAPAGKPDKSKSLVPTNPFAALAAKPKPKSGSKTPEVRIPELMPAEDAPIVACPECEGKGKMVRPTGLPALIKANNRKKDLEGEIKEMQADFYPMMEDRRKQVCQASGEFHGSIRVNGVATFITKNQYSPAEVSAINEAVGVAAEILGISAEDATKKVMERFTMKTVVTIKNQALLEDAAFQAKLIALVGADNLDLKMALTPNETFHQASAIKPEEGKLMKALVEAKLIRPWAPSIRQSGDAD